MSYDRMGPRIEELEAEVAAMLAEAEAADAAEDAAFGEDKRGDEVPAELATKERRLAKLARRQGVHRGRGEGEGSAKGPGKGHRKRCQRGRGPSRRCHSGRGRRHRRRSSAQIHRPRVTDDEDDRWLRLRLQRSGRGRRRSSVIVAHSVTNQATDVQQLVEMIEPPRPTSAQRHRREPRHVHHRTGTIRSDPSSANPIRNLGTYPIAMQLGARSVPIETPPAQPQPAQFASYDDPLHDVCCCLNQPRLSFNTTEWRSHRGVSLASLATFVRMY